jgi:hypothetical protein
MYGAHKRFILPDLPGCTTLSTFNLIASDQCTHLRLALQILAW